jgi:tetratricopeptide (TPR) repeat protein
MQIRQIEERTRVHRERTREAIALATLGRWAEAIEVNRALRDAYPDDVEARNRLGKALSELGRYSEARAAFQAALKKSPSNTIARKNLERLARLKDAPTVQPAERLTPQLFIEEHGKSCITTLRSPAPRDVLAQVAAGDRACLKLDGATIQVTAKAGALLGHLEPKLAARLVRLIQGGNQYVAAVASVSDSEVSVALREAYQNPKMGGMVSFPSHIGEMAAYPAVSERDLGEEEDVDSALLQEWPASTPGGESARVGNGTRAPRSTLAENVEEEEET